MGWKKKNERAFWGLTKNALQKKEGKWLKKKREGSALKHQNSIFGALNLYRPKRTQI